jgi:hypothetical protein
MEWISVKDRLPEEEGEYLTIQIYKLKPIKGIEETPKEKANVCIEGYSTIRCEEWDSEICGGAHPAFYYSGKVTHWMPLPEPPQN